VGISCISLRFGLPGAYRGILDFKVWPSREDFPFAGKGPPQRQPTPVTARPCGVRKQRLSDFPEAHRARSELQGQGWARDHWFLLQSVVDRMKVLQKEASVTRGEGKAIIGAVLGASLAAVLEERNQRSGQAEATVDSLQAATEMLREQLRENKQLLEEERCQNVILTEELRGRLLREAGSLAQTEVALAEKAMRLICPQEDLKGVKETLGSPPTCTRWLKRNTCVKTTVTVAPRPLLNKSPSRQLNWQSYEKIL